MTPDSIGSNQGGTPVDGEERLRLGANERDRSTSTSSASVAASFVPVSNLGDSRTDGSHGSDFESPGAASEPIAEAADAGAVEPDAEPFIATAAGIDLGAIQHDLEGVQTALERLNEGTYWTDEITGQLIPNEILDAFPLTRTVAGNAAG